jgi:hypothetical protein
MGALMEINSALAGRADAYGSVVFRYKAKAMRNLYASVMVHDTGHPIMYHLDATNQPHGWQAGSREGIWWLPTKTVHDYLILTNESEHPISGKLHLFDQEGKDYSQPFEIVPRGTERLSVRDLLNAGGLVGLYGGIKIEMAKDAGSLTSSHITYDETSGFGATLKMFDHDPLVTKKSRDYAGTGKWITRAPMLALMHPDPALSLPARTVLHPVVFIRNTTGDPVGAVVNFHWRGTTGTGDYDLPDLSLQPNEVRRIDVAELQRSGKIPKDAYWAQASISTDANPDSLMAVAASFDSSLRYGAQTPFSDQLADHLEGGEWKVDATHTSIIAAGNGGNQPVDALLTLLYDQGRKHYSLKHTIAPKDQWFVNFGELIRSGTADDAGTVLPRDLTSGAYSLVQQSPPGKAYLFEGKVITDKIYGHATYGCMVCCGYGGDAGPIYIFPAPLTVADGGSTYVDVYGDNACTGNPDMLDDYVWSWSSDNSEIATASDFQITGIGVGTANINASMSSVPSGDGEDWPYGCPMGTAYPEGPVNVIPTVTISGPSLVPISGSETTNTIQLTASGNPTGGTYAWTTSNSSVTIGSPSNSQTNVSSTAGGVTSVTVTYTVGSQSATADQTFYVQIPNYFVTTGISHISTPSDCTSITGPGYVGAGYFVDLANYVADPNGAQISAGGISLSETANGITYSNYATPTTTNSNGTFDDTPFGACFASASPTTNYCQNGSTVTHAAGYQGVNYTIPTVYGSRECTLGISLNNHR